MDLPVTVHDIERAESFVAAGDIETALPQLEELTGSVRAWAEEECADTKDRQWFAFEDAFERLAYRRVERDPRELVQVDVPLGRLFSALAFAYIRQRDFTAARDALMQAVRWNPMNSAYRLDLAEVFRALGDAREWAQLSYSVVERASDGRSAGLAYANLGQMFLDEGNPMAAAGAGRLAERLAPAEARVGKLSERLAAEAADAVAASDDAVFGELSLQGIPTAPSAEVAICLLMCASDAARAGDTAQATDFTVRARNLVGDAPARALIQLIHESDAELAREKSSDPGAGSEGE